MLILLSENSGNKTNLITQDFMKDWFNTFISVYNGVSFFNISLVKLMVVPLHYHYN